MDRLRQRPPHRGSYTTGTGKSFLAQALAVAACRKKLTARYYRLNDLANDFDAAAEHPQARKQLLADLQAPALIVIDDFSRYRCLSARVEPGIQPARRA